jgi:integrase
MNGVERELNSLMSNTLECNRRYFKNVYEGMVVRGCKPKTIEFYLYALGVFACNFKNIDIGLLSSLEIAMALQGLEELRYSAHTIRHVKRSVKMFYTKFRGKVFARFIKLGEVHPELRHCDLITKEELWGMISAAKTLRDMAMLAVLYDGALRRQELLGLRLRDVDFSNGIVHITVTGKTGTRTIPLTFSGLILKRYVDATPRFWEQGSLWDIGINGLRAMIDSVRDRIRINKRVYPYVFRHSRITELSNILSEAQLKCFAGWSQNSPMPRNYVHLCVNDLDRVILAKQ